MRTTGTASPWAWALAPLAPRGEAAETAFQKLRLIAPPRILREAAARLRELGGWVSAITPASPPLHDAHQVVLAATVAAFQRLIEMTGPDVGRALSATLEAITSSVPALRLGRHRFDFASRVYVVGILNNTPDSFFDRGQYFGLDRALARAEEMVGEGVDVIEVGGESAQAGEPVPTAEEMARVAPLIEELDRRYKVPLSVDTYKAEVARAAIEAGAVMVNDISALADPAMPAVIASTGAGVVLMHLHGRPKELYADLDVPSMMDWVAAFLRQRIEVATTAGIPRARLLIDPGLNFGKRPHRDLELMQRLPELRSFGLPVFVATSRKDYIRDLLHLPPDELLEGTAAAVAFAVAGGANLVRVHDVGPMVRVVRMMEYLVGHRHGDVNGRASDLEPRTAAGRPGFKARSP